MESRSCQRNGISVFDEITRLVDKSNSVDVMDVIFCEAFGVILHDSLIKNLIGLQLSL